MSTKGIYKSKNPIRATPIKYQAVISSQRYQDFDAFILPGFALPFHNFFLSLGFNFHSSSMLSSNVALPIFDQISFSCLPLLFLLRSSIVFHFALATVAPYIVVVLSPDQQKSVEAGP